MSICAGIIANITFSHQPRHFEFFGSNSMSKSYHLTFNANFEPKFRFRSKILKPLNNQMLGPRNGRKQSLVIKFKTGRYYRRAGIGLLHERRTLDMV